MRVRFWVSLSLALFATLVVIAVGFAQTTTPAIVTHHSVPITLQVAAPGSGQLITVTLVLDIEASPGSSPSEPAIKLKVTPKRTVASEGATIGAVTVGDIASANAVATPAPVVAAPSLGGLLPTPTPAPTATPAPPAKVNDAANLRKGPGTDFAIVGRAKAGDGVTIVGRNAASDWLQLAEGSWIAAFLIDDIPANLPVVATTAP